MRPSNRKPDEMREITFETGVSDYAEGSCMVSFGKTRVLCTASVEDYVPPFLRNTGKGWVTAEYAMLPRATHSRNQREVSKGKPSGRTMEIQRLIGRSFRSVTNLAALGERQVIVDCDVINADGGTRTAAISGGYVALALAMKHLQNNYQIKENPLSQFVAAVSCGIYQGTPILDLEYAEDSNAEADTNFVMTDKGGIIEVQGTAEGDPFTRKTFDALQDLAEKGIAEIIAKQKEALEG